MLHKVWNSKGEMPYCFARSSIKFQGHTVQNITNFDPNWAFPDYRPVAAFKSLRFALFGFQPLTLIWFWIPTRNLSGTILMYMCRSLLIFSNVNFKMAARQPYWNFWFPDSNFSLVGWSTAEWSQSAFTFWGLQYRKWRLKVKRKQTLSCLTLTTHCCVMTTNFSLALNINCKPKWHNTYIYG